MWINIKLYNNVLGIGCGNYQNGNNANLETVPNNNCQIWFTPSLSNQNKDGGDDDSNHHGSSKK